MSYFRVYFDLLFLLFWRASSQVNVLVLLQVSVSVTSISIHTNLVSFTIFCYFFACFIYISFCFLFCMLPCSLYLFSANR